MKKTPARRKFECLVRDIMAIYARMRSALIHDYWQIGKMIVEGEQDGDVYAQYGTALLKHLSAALAVCGKGFSEQNLGRMRRLYREYPNSSAPIKLEWSNYVELLSLKDPKERRRQIERFQSRRISTRQMREFVRNAKGTTDRRSLSESATQKKDRPRLRPPRSVRLGTYRRVPPERFVAPRGYVAIDCGFSAYRIVPRKDAPRCSEKPSYTYAASVTNVVDGDTLRITIDAGYGLAIDTRVRLRGIDAPELSTAEGRAVKRKLQSLLLIGSTIVIKTSGRDIYGRYRADVWFSQTNRIDDPSQIVREGTYLNNYLLEQGLVARM